MRSHGRETLHSTTGAAMLQVSMATAPDRGEPAAKGRGIVPDCSAAAPPPLEAYRKKRDPDHPEPFGGRLPGGRSPLRGAEARRASAALRPAPRDGRVLKSWAVPKGPSGHAEEKRLAAGFNVYFTKELGMDFADCRTSVLHGQCFRWRRCWRADRAAQVGNDLGTGGDAVHHGAGYGGVATGTTGAVAGMIYSIYVASQYMSEPGIYSLLMERVSPEERSGTSSMNFLIVFGGQALAAAIAGVAVRVYGYRVVLGVAAVVALSAGLLMRRVLEQRAPALSSTEPISSR